MEGLWGWGGWEVDPHDAQPASLARGSTIPWGRGSATRLKGSETRKTGGIQLVMGVWDSASSPVTKLGPGAQRVAKLWVDLSLQDCSQVSRCPPSTLALQPQGNWVSQVPPRHCTLCSAGQ